MCHTAYVESPVHLTRGHRAHFEKELSLPGKRKLLPRRSCRKLMDACTRRTVSNPEGKSSSCVAEHQSICCFGQGLSCLGNALSGKTVQRAVPDLVGVAQNCPLYRSVKYDATLD